MSSIAKFTVVSSLVGMTLFSCSCNSEQAPPAVKVDQEAPQMSPLETEVLKLLKKEPFDRDLIYQKTKSLNLEQKLALVNRLAEEHNIERMNMLKGRVRMGIIDDEQAIAASKQRQKETLEDINDLLKEKAREEGLLQE